MLLSLSVLCMNSPYFKLCLSIFVTLLGNVSLSPQGNLHVALLRPFLISVLFFCLRDTTKVVGEILKLKTISAYVFQNLHTFICGAQAGRNS